MASPPAASNSWRQLDPQRFHRRDGRVSELADFGVPAAADDARSVERSNDRREMHDALIVRRMGADGSLAAAAQRAQIRAFGAHADVRCRVRQRGCDASGVRFCAARFDCERTLADRWRELLRVKGDGVRGGDSEPPHPGTREHDRRILAVAQLAQTGIERCHGCRRTRDPTAARGAGRAGAGSTFRPASRAAARRSSSIARCKTRRAGLRGA